jgi:tetratricopeptide (TPR) repeat protein
MPGLNYNRPKLLKKSQKLIVQLGFLLALTGCASSAKNTQNKSDDATGNIGQNAQHAWEANPAFASSDYHFTLAQAYSSEGKVDRAIEEFRAALAYDSQSSLLHAKLAAEYLKKGSMSFAIDECKESLKTDPNSVDVHLMLGGIYSLNNEPDSALTEYATVLKLDSRNDEAAVFKTQVLVERDQIDEALKFIRTFTSTVKDSAAAWFYLGKLEQNKEHSNEAISAFRKALALRPGFTQASMALGMIFEVHGQNPQAMEVYEAQLEEKQDIPISGRLVTIYLKANQMDKALALLQTMSVLDPEDLNTQLRIGLLHMQKEDWANARKTFETLLVKVPDSDKVHYYLAATYEQQGQVNQTIEQLLKVSPESKLFEDANLHAVGIYRKLLQKDEAFKTVKAAVARSPENAGFYLVMASMYEDEKKIREAADALAQGLKVFPDHEKMRYFFGALLEKLGKPDEAVEEMQKILVKSPDHADALNFIAYTWSTQGIHLKDAEELLKRALKLKPNNPFILDSMGWNQFLLGHSQDALVYLEKAAGLKSDEEAILEHLVEVYAKNQMPERAQAMKARIMKLQSQATTSRVPASDETK